MQRPARPKPRCVPLQPFPAQPVAQADVPPARRLASTLGLILTDSTLVMNRTYLLPCLLALALAGCGTNPLTTPYAAHPSEIKRSETAILISMDRQGSPPLLATLVEIDGKAVDCDWNAGCPVWARTSPGAHKFTIRYRTDFYGAPGVTSSGHKFATLSVDVQDMRPRHVYVVRYIRDFTSNTVRAEVQDMGERAKTGILFPFGVANPAEYLAEF